MKTAPRAIWLAVPLLLAGCLGGGPLPGEGASVPDGPGVALEQARVSMDGDTLLLHSGTVHFRRDATTLPEVSHIALPDLDVVLTPMGTTSVEVARAGAGASVEVREGRVRVERSDQVLGSVLAGLDGATLTATTVEGGDFSAVPEGLRATDRDPIPGVALDGDSELPAILLLLGAHAHAQRPVELAASVRAAEEIRSTRPLVPLAQRLDAQLVDAALQPLVWDATARSRQAAGQLDEALVANDRIPKDHWLYGRSRLRASRIHAEQKRLARARVELTRAIEAGGHTAPAARLAMGQLLLALGDEAGAREQFQTAGMPSPTADRLEDPSRAAETWSPELSVINALLVSPDPWRLCMGDDAAASATLQSRLRGHPAIRELLAEEQALEALHASLSTTLDPTTTEAWEEARTSHQLAANRATRRTLQALAHEIRLAVPPSTSDGLGVPDERSLE